MKIKGTPELFDRSKDIEVIIYIAEGSTLGVKARPKWASPRGRPSINPWQ